MSLRRYSRWLFQASSGSGFPGFDRPASVIAALPLHRRERTYVAGIEVKDEAKPLDVKAVEALCMKLGDMPSITRRAIVSASGFTAPARRKARHHRVELMALRPWTQLNTAPLPHLASKFSATAEMRGVRWADVPRVCIITDPELTFDRIPEDAIAVLSDGRTIGLELSAVTVRDGELDRLIATDEFKTLKTGELKHVALRVNAKPRLELRFPGRSVTLVSITIEGDVTVRVTQEPLPLKVLVNEQDGTPQVAYAVCLHPQGHLVGFAFMAMDQDPHLLQIAVSDRNRSTLTRLALAARQRIT